MRLMRAEALTLREIAELEAQGCVIEPYTVHGAEML